MSVITYENNPHSALAHYIDRTLWFSITLSILIFGVSFFNLGSLSLLIAPLLALVTIVQHAILLSHVNGDRKRPAASIAGTLAHTARKPAIVFLWVLVALWIIVVVLVTSTSFVVKVKGRQEWWQKHLGHVELGLEALEVVVVLVAAVKCGVQRRRTIIEPDHVDWEHLGA
ncbi:hypothetical protein CVT24_003772 [Panaeolus cyanescens]|uniref:Uncharacterized protein n=1 Tax=Panaeolus cyanescens TaxID=181874 RepID=A0A409WC54_9AGAR|nr:hypothetical protein CVT24_003772 [Panaeolus cyanescens]